MLSFGFGEKFDFFLPLFLYLGMSGIEENLSFCCRKDCPYGWNYFRWDDFVSVDLLV